MRLMSYCFSFLFVVLSYILELVVGKFPHLSQNFDLTATTPVKSLKISTHCVEQDYEIDTAFKHVL